MSPEPGESAAMQHCVDILTGGFVQSYVEFFYLQSRAAEGAAGGAAAGTAIPEAALGFVKERLTGAERARRSGNPGAVFDNYDQLAEQFASRGDHATAVHFFLKCLKLSQQFADAVGEKKATLRLGLVYSAMAGETGQAIEQLERHLALAAEQADEAACASARVHLSVVYDRRARELDAGDVARSVGFLDRLLRLATENRDALAKADANFRLGRAYNRLDKPERAVVALAQALDHAQQVGDLAAQGACCAALADAYLRMEGKTVKALGFLHEARRIAKQSGDEPAQAHACRVLGCVLTRQGEHLEAVHYLESNFAIARRQENGLAETDRARVLLGVALKNARRAQLRTMVNNSGTAPLLKWKVDRQFVEAPAANKQD
jgi:tetratricopeptide (TPR) repeat protein